MKWLKGLILSFVLLSAGVANAQLVAQSCSAITLAATAKATCFNYADQKLKYWDGNSWEDIATAAAGAPTDATYITQTANGSLSNEQALGSLSNGILKHSGGVVAQAAAGTDYAAPPSGSANTPLFNNGSGGFTNGTRSGNTTQVATVTGTKTTNKQLAFDSDGNVIASAEDIGGGGEGGGSPGGSDTQVQFNDGGSFGGDGGMVFDKTNNVLTVSGDVVVGSQSVCLEDGTNCPASGAVGDLLDYHFVKKTGDETVNNSNTLQDDDHLSIAIGASQTFICDCVLKWGNASNASADFKYMITAPSGATGFKTQLGPDTGTSATSITTVNLAGFGTEDWSTTAIAVGQHSTTGVTLLWVKFIVVNSTTPGNITLQWAQNTMTAINTTVYTNSFMECRRI